MKTVTVEVPDDVWAALGATGTEVEKTVRLAAAIHWHRRGLIAEQRAAEIARITLAELRLESEELSAPISEDEDQIAERLTWSPPERLKYLLDMLAFKERARRARPLPRSG